MKSSFTLNDSWAWYVFIFPQFFYFIFIFIFILDTILILFFFSFFFFFFFLKAVQSTFRLEEMFHSLYQQLDNERERRVTAMQTLTIAENSNADLRKKLTAEE